MPACEYFMSLAMVAGGIMGGSTDAIKSMQYGKRDEREVERCGDVRNIPGVEDE